MPVAERRSARSGRSLARAERLAREARERGLREGNAGRPAVGARYARAGLRHLGWTEDGTQPDARQVDEAHHALAARLLGILAQWESEQGRTEYGLRLLDRAESLVAAEDRGVLLLQRGLMLMRTWPGSRRAAASRRGGSPAGRETGGDREPGHRPAESQLRLPQRRPRPASPRRPDLVPPRRGRIWPRPDRGQGACTTWATATCWPATSRPRCSCSARPPARTG